MLVDIHSEWMGDLLAIRAQSGTRGLIARQYVPAFRNDSLDFSILVLYAIRQVKKKKLTAAQEADEKKKAKLDKAAAKIQALIRGVLARQEYRRVLPALRKAKQARGFCVECEAKVCVEAQLVVLLPLTVCVCT